MAERKSSDSKEAIFRYNIKQNGYTLRTLSEGISIFNSHTETSARFAPAEISDLSHYIEKKILYIFSHCANKEVINFLLS